MISNKLYYLKILPEDLYVKRNNIIRLLGYQEVKNAKRNIISKIDYYVKKCIKICRPQGCYIFINKIKIDQKNKEIELSNITLKIGDKIISQLKNTEALALFVCTAGKEIENLSKKLITKNKYLEGYIVDLIGSEIAEAIAELMHKKIIERVKSLKLKTTNRISPGYCNWNVIEQLKLFSFFPINTCKISLTEKGLMYPIKSVSGIIGIGKNVKFKDNSCEICGLTSCKFRAIKNQNI